MPLFIAANGVFIVVFIAIALYQPPIWGWILFGAAWCVADYFIIKKTNIHLKNWQWGVFIAALTAIDLIVLFATGQL